MPKAITCKVIVKRPCLGRNFLSTVQLAKSRKGTGPTAIPPLDIVTLFLIAEINGIKIFPHFVLTIVIKFIPCRTIHIVQCLTGIQGFVQ